LESSKEDKWLKEMKPKNCSTDSERQASLLTTKDINTKWFMIIEQAKNDQLGLHKFTQFYGMTRQEVVKRVRLNLMNLLN